MIAALVSVGCPAGAQEVAGTASAPPPDASLETESSGPPVPAIVAFVIAGAAFAAGTGLLVYGAFEASPDDEAVASGSPVDPGVGGRGLGTPTANTSTGAASEPEGSKVPYDIGAALLGAGAVALTVGLVIAYRSEPEQSKERSSSAVRVRPTRDGFRVTF